MKTLEQTFLAALRQGLAGMTLASDATVTTTISKDLLRVELTASGKVVAGATVHRGIEAPKVSAQLELPSPTPAADVSPTPSADAPTVPPKPRTTKPKAPKSHRLTPHPDADPLAQHGMATVSYLDSEGWHSLGRQPGENASAWKGRYTAILGEVSAELHRVYDGARRCTYDSRDGAP